MMKKHDKIVIIKAAKAGGKIARKYFGTVVTVERKSIAADYRTIADTESEKAIIKILTKAFPKYNIFSEECGMTDRKSEYTFYIDPIDGTNNFFLGIPNFSVLISLAKGKETIFGLVYLPMIDVVYYAEKGGGAFCGDKRIKPNSETLMSNITFSYSCAYGTSKSETARVLGNIMEKGQVKRTMINWAPAVDFCMLASGKIESMVNIKTEIYDFLGSKLILREAGCVITDLEGKSDNDDFNPTFVVSNNLTIHHQILPLLQKSSK